MTRTKSDERRRAILDAACRVIAERGTAAPTALIAREAGVSNGSLFSYFPSKPELFDELYIDLKCDLAAAVLTELPTAGSSRDRARHVWSNWTRWGTAAPDKRHALAALDGSHELTDAARSAANDAMRGVAQLLEETRQDGPLRAQPAQFVLGLVDAIAGATMHFMALAPDQANRLSDAGFVAVWRALGPPEPSHQ